MVESERDSPPKLTFNQPAAESTSWFAWGAAGGAILIGIGLLLAFGGHKSSPAFGSAPGLAPADPYAANLAVSGVHMSEASNFAGGKVTYLDGQITNHGDRTIVGVTVQVAFRNDLKEIAQKETMPLSLIRTREPYVDTQPVSASPLKPGETREFRLIFDSVPADWNQEYPEVRLVQISGSSAAK